MEHPDYSRYRGLVGPLLTSPAVLERDALRRFTQAIMDDDPLYHDDTHARQTLFGEVVAPPLMPVHMFRRAPGSPDPLRAIQDDPDSDGTAGSDSLYLGLPPIETPFKRLLNGGGDIEFYRALKLGEAATAQARYLDVELKLGASGAFVAFVIETTWRTGAGELLLIQRRTFIWR